MSQILSQSTQLGSADCVERADRLACAPSLSLGSLLSPAPALSNLTLNYIPSPLM
ncbi:hypothetical protein RSAG8_12094, partial [Rhizoctonia solani AG-8 WAC10335]